MTANMHRHKNENVTDSPKLCTPEIETFCLMKNENGQFVILIIPIICQLVDTSSNRVLETIIKLLDLSLAK